MSARRQIIAALSEDSLGGIATMEDVAHAEQLVDSHRTEVLTEGATELDRIADETEARVAEHYGAASGIGPGSAEMVREAARTLRSLSREKATDVQSATATPDFFQADRTYQRRRWLFQCLAIAPNPFNGETRAVGYLFRPGEPATATALDPDDWEHGGWTHVTETGGRS